MFPGIKEIIFSFLVHFEIKVGFLKSFFLFIFILLFLVFGKLFNQILMKCNFTKLSWNNWDFRNIIFYKLCMTKNHPKFSNTIWQYNFKINLLMMIMMVIMMVTIMMMMNSCIVIGNQYVSNISGQSEHGIRKWKIGLEWIF